MGVAPFFYSGKSTTLAYFNTEKCLLYKYTYDIPLVTLMVPTPCYSQSQVESACQSSRPEAPLFFWLKVSFCVCFVFNTEKGVAL